MNSPDQQIISQLWPQIYRYLRSIGVSHHDAEDLTQETLVSLNRRGLIEPSDDGSDSLTVSYALTTAKHLMIDQHRRAHRQKRVRPQCESSDGTALTEVEPTLDHNTPHTEVTRREAWQAWDREVARLADELSRDGRAALFNRLRPVIRGGERAEGLAEMAQQFGMNLPALRVQIHRWRRRLIANLQQSYADCAAA